MPEFPDKRERNQSESLQGEPAELSQETFDPALRDLSNSLFDSSLANELITMDTADQQLRQEWRPDMDEQLLKRFHDLDQKHTARLKEIVEELGEWPSISRVGEAGSLAAWRLTIHADFDREFQKAALQQMDVMPEQEVPPWQRAYLEDRIRASENPPQPQRFGTQFRLIDGTFQPFPAIENLALVDTLRAAYGLPPLAEDIAAMNKTPS